MHGILSLNCRMTFDEQQHKKLRHKRADSFHIKRKVSVQLSQRL